MARPRRRQIQVPADRLRRELLGDFHCCTRPVPRRSRRGQDCSGHRRAAGRSRDPTPSMVNCNGRSASGRAGRGQSRPRSGARPRAARYSPDLLGARPPGTAIDDHRDGDHLGAPSSRSGVDRARTLIRWSMCPQTASNVSPSDVRAFDAARRMCLVLFSHHECVQRPPFRVHHRGRDRVRPESQPAHRVVVQVQR